MGSAKVIREEMMTVRGDMEKMGWREEEEAKAIMNEDLLRMKKFFAVVKR